ncbi:MAG: 4Fe-4S ferredoxin [Betaproteobacteria bacterium]|nr:4Fe-4S ferredoxin [Betaproteobacteria bacterium]
MPLAGKTLKVCSCNRTMALDAKALATALKAEAAITVHAELCRRDAGAFTAALGDSDVIVACTQEAPLFAELAEAERSKANIRFVNVREFAGWSADAKAATPKIAALVAMAALPEPEPVTAVSYSSSGQLLIVGPAAAAIAWAERLAPALDVCVLATSSRDAELPLERAYPVWSGAVKRITGWLGAFEVEWQQENPIDLEVCTRCNACISACPESAIDFSYQVDMAKCKSHRACVKACGSIGAIDFGREAAPRTEKFDMVLDLSREPHLKLHALPQGYLAPGDDPLEQALAAQKLGALVGEFEKPRFVAYQERICAHSRSGQEGCNRCIDVCSSGAIRAAGDYVHVEPHLCAGCGGCATVCPSGAMSYTYPRIADLGLRVKTLLATYRGAGGRDACLLIHDQERGRALLQSLGRRTAMRGRGLPARVIPLETFHVASVGMDLLLSAIAHGASQVRVLAPPAVAPDYVAALRAQMAWASAILAALGYEGTHLEVIEADDPGALEGALWGLVPARGVEKAATFNLPAQKRGALDFAIDHLARHAPAPQEQVALRAGAPFGAIVVDRDACTLCKACIGACPEAALLDSPETPMLRFIERNCVQCGLCANTCPEDAITLLPRLLLSAQAKEPVVLHEDQPFNCTSCGKPFGTKSMVENMMGKLGGHSMFASSGALKRLQMCADCRVVDMMNAKNEPSILDFPRKS